MKFNILFIFNLANILFSCNIRDKSFDITFVQTCYPDSKSTALSLNHSSKSAMKVNYKTYVLNVNKTHIHLFLNHIENRTRKEIEQLNIKFKRKLNPKISLYNCSNNLSSDVYYVHEDMGVLYSNRSDYSIDCEWRLLKHELHAQSTIDSLTALCTKDFVTNREKFFETNRPKKEKMEF
jgi:hypothetical protein